MCWSFSVSLAFATLEAICLSFLVWRWYKKSEESKVIRDQLFVFPLLFTILFVEIAEVMLWSEGEKLRRISEAADSSCTTWNTCITRFICVLVGAQPFFCVVAGRYTGVKENDEMLKPLFYISFFNFLAWMVFLFWGETANFELGNIQQSNFLGMHNFQTCTFVGVHGHLHWLFKISEFYLAPNCYAYLLIVLQVIITARPWTAVSGPVTSMLLILSIILAVFKASFEAGSVWCWSGMVLFLIFIIQPYILIDRGDRFLLQNLLKVQNQDL